MIPQKIHCCWFGRAQKSNLHERCIESWHKIMPNYEIVEWNEDNFVFDSDFLNYHYKNKNWAFVSDYARLKVLNQVGGIYLDTDIEVVKDFSPLLADDLFIGYESKNRINTAVIGSTAGHPFLIKALEYMTARHAAKQPYEIAPEVASSVIANNKFDKNLTIYPEEYFYPYNPYDKDRGLDNLMFSDITKNTYAIHHWAKSWNMSLTQKIKRKISKLF